jgi:hypothetical protein
MHKLSRHVDVPVGKRHGKTWGLKRFGREIQLGATWVWNDRESFCGKPNAYRVFDAPAFVLLDSTIRSFCSIRGWRWW